MTKDADTYLGYYHDLVDEISLENGSSPEQTEARIQHYATMIYRDPLLTALVMAATTGTDYPLPEVYSFLMSLAAKPTKSPQTPPHNQTRQS